MTKQMQISEASSLIGKSVVGVGDTKDSLNPSANIVAGKVTGMSVQNGIYYLTVQEADGGFAQMQMGNIQAVGA